MKAVIDINYLDEVNRRLMSSYLSEPVYKVKLRYFTRRNNEKKDYRYIVAPSKEDAERKMLLAINEYNEQYPHRALLNVEILSSKHEGYADLKIVA